MKIIIAFAAAVGLAAAGTTAGPTGDIATLKGDLFGLSASGLPALAGATAPTKVAQQAVSATISSANADSSQANADDADAFQMVNGPATGACPGSGGTPGLGFMPAGHAGINPPRR